MEVQNGQQLISGFTLKVLHLAPALDALGSEIFSSSCPFKAFKNTKYYHIVLFSSDTPTTPNTSLAIMQTAMNGQMQHNIHKYSEKGKQDAKQDAHLVQVVVLSKILG